MVNNKWYFSTWFIAVLFAFWFLVVPLIIGLYLLSLQNKESSARQNYIESIISKEKVLQMREIEQIKQQKELEDEKFRESLSAEIVIIEFKRGCIKIKGK
jgi:hypothetical protein